MDVRWEERWRALESTIDAQEIARQRIREEERREAAELDRERREAVRVEWRWRIGIAVAMLIATVSAITSILAG
jgi:hypothetical protein